MAQVLGPHDPLPKSALPFPVPAARPNFASGPNDEDDPDDEKGSDKTDDDSDEEEAFPDVRFVPEHIEPKGTGSGWW